MEYKVKYFGGHGNSVATVSEYEKWLKQCVSVELVSVNVVGKYNESIFVTYIENKIQ